MDILSAALDESGITGEDYFDFDGGTSTTQTTQATPVIQQPVVTPQKLVTVPSNIQHVPVTINGHPAPVFSQALKSLASQNELAIQQRSQVPSPASPAPAGFHRSASSPAIIKMPSTITQPSSVANIPQILRQHSAQITGSPAGQAGKTQIITVKRVGPNGNVTQSRSFAIDAKTASGISSGGHKIIVRSANGNSSQVIQAPTVTSQQMTVPAGGANIKLPVSMLQATSANQSSVAPVIDTSSNSSNGQQFKQFSNSFSINSGKVTIKESDSSVLGPQSIVRTQPHVIQINRPIPVSGSATVNKTMAQSVVNSARLVPNQNSLSNPNIHVIHRPFQTISEHSSVLKPSHSVPAGLTTYSNINKVPPHVLNVRNTNSPPTIQLKGHPGLVGGKMVWGNGHLGDFNHMDMLDGSSLLAMQKSVQNLPISTKVTNKDVQRMWSNQDVRLKSLTQNNHNVNVPTSVVEEEEEGEEVEGLGQAETYSDYMPSKLNLGVKHPDPVVETSSMSSIEPPDIFYRLSIPESTIDYGELSALQLESIVYASQRHSIIMASGERAGFLIGDGAGVGKGRTIAGVIFENYLLGRKRALWLSVSNDLRIDAERDLRDIGATKIDVHPLNKFKYAKISGKENGSVKKGVIFSTYSSLIGESHSSGKYRTRFKQLIKWCGKDFDGVIIFDECHKAKNLCPTGSSKPTKTGQTVLELQKRLPKARVVYASATGASEPKNMAYMTRLGLWGAGTPFPEFNDFIQAVEKRGVGAMELVAMDMKLRGMYIARQLSFKGVTFKIEEIPIDKEYIKMYNEAVTLWVDAREMFQEAADLVDAEHRMRKSMWGQFWSAHQRFFKYLCISAKVAHCVRIVREAMRDGKCVVIGLQSTGEARTLEQVEELGNELNDFVSTAKGVLQTLVEKHFPAPDRRKFFDVFGLGGSSSIFNSEDSNSSSTFGGIKRKREQSQINLAKRTKTGSDCDSSSSDSEIDFGLSDTSDDSEDSESDNDDFNPFGDGSDSDDDPWLKRKKAKSKVKEKKKKEKKKKEKKKKKKEKKKNEDEEYDKALAAAGLLKKESSQNGSNGQNNPSGDAIDKAFAMKKELLDRIELLGEKLPANTLDQLIDDLGGPDNVAEMTGRKGRIVCTDEGINYESRSETDVPLEILNLTEKQRFMDGEKNIAIISEAASSGISLQADRRALNQRRRVHITLELPWSADRAIQQFGRTHRSNQVSAPEYIFLISELAGEQRFASTVSKRLESLGALTHGDRRATESRDLSRFNFDNKFGRLALESVMKTVCGFENPLVPLPEYSSNFLQDAKRSLIGVGLVAETGPGSVPILEKDYNNISKFLNRILGMEVTLQNALFKFFSQSMTTIILEAKKSGRWDMGILDLGSGGESVKKVETRIFVGNTATNTAKTELCTVLVERGMSFPAALDIYKKYQGIHDGFYISLQDRSVRRFAMVAAYQGAYNKKKEKLYTVYRPNTGLQPRQEPLDEIKRRYKKVLPEEAQRYWEQQYNESASICSHAYWRGSCKKVSLGLPCEIGLRTRTYYILSGSVLSVWNKVESVLASIPTGAQTKMQIIRLRTDDNDRIVGSLIPSNCVDSLCNVLSQECSKSYTEKHSEPTPKPREIEEASGKIQSHTTAVAPQTSSQAVYSMPVLV